MENRLGRRHPLVQFLLDNGIYILIALVMWRMPHLLGNYFDQPINPPRPQGNQPVYWMGVLVQLYILAILAMSYNLLFGFAGIISFGHALFFGLGVYVLVIMMSEFLYPLMIAVGLALAIPIIFALLTGLAAFRIKGVYFAMFTLALAQIFHDMVRVNMFKFLTRGDDGRTLDNLPDWISPIRERFVFYYLAAFLAAVTFVLIRRLMNSPSGRVILAIRENEERAQTMGYNTVLYKTLVIVVAGTLAAQAGILHAMFSRQAEPGSLSLTRTVDPLLMTIIGGTGTHPGPAIGATLLHMGETFFRKPDLHVDLNFILFHVSGTVNTTEVWRMILGVVFILIVLAVPFGVVGQVNVAWVKVRQFLRQTIYDRAVRQNPRLAEWAEPFTGESPELARQLAKLSQDTSPLVWLQTNPLLAGFSVSLVVAVVGGLVTWNLDNFIALMLFFSLFLLPLVVVVWWQENRQQLLEQLSRWRG